MKSDIDAYHKTLAVGDRRICKELRRIIDAALPKAESKVWHRHPVWFLDGNPTVGYHKLKAGLRLMFWSGASFKTLGLEEGTGKFKDASITYTDVKEIDEAKLKRWLKESRDVQWDYKNIVKRKGRLERLR